MSSLSSFLDTVKKDVNQPQDLIGHATNIQADVDKAVQGVAQVASVLNVLSDPEVAAVTSLVPGAPAAIAAAHVAVSGLLAFLKAL